MNTPVAEKKNRSRLGKLLLIRILLFSVILTVLFTSVQAVIDYRTRIGSIQRSMDEIFTVHSKGIIAALWNFDHKVLEAQIEGMLHRHHINYLAIIDNKNIVIAAGKRQLQSTITREIPLVFNHRGNDIQLGILYIQADTTSVARDIAIKMAGTFFISLTIVSISSFFLLYMFNRLVTRRLSALADYFGDPASDLAHMSTPLKLTKKPGTDEIDIIVESFNSLREKLALSYEELRQSRDKFSALYNGTPVLMHSIDAEDRIVEVNDYWLKVLGYERSEVLGKKSTDFLTEESRGYAREVVVPAFFRDGSVSKIPYQFVTKNGEIVDALLSASSERDANGRIVRSRTVIEDITETKQIEVSLRESEEQFRALVEQSITGIAVIQNSVFAYVNPRMAEILGYQAEELINMSPPDIVVEADREKVRESIRKRMSGELQSEHYSFFIKRKDDKERLVEVYSSSITYKGRPAFLSTLLDITERKTAEEQRDKLEMQLRQAQKMEAIGQLAGGIAHDFNNILTAIIGYSSLALAKIGDDDPNRHYIEEVMASANRATILTQSLLAFSRRQVVHLSKVDLNEIVTRFEKFLLRLLREDIELRTEKSEQGLPIFADRGQIEQILMNLVTNARDAMPNGGRITISTCLVELDPSFIATHEIRQADRYAQLSVTDTGIGMTEDIKNRIFEPFFTTKPEGKGTGLGLAMVYGIVKQHKGHIEVFSQPGAGTTFRIYLPLEHFVPEETAQPSVNEAAFRGGTETILIAEDDRSVLRLNATLFREYGYRVIEAVDGADAVAKFNEHRDSISLVILDGIMPRMNGKDAWHAIKEMKPEIKAVFLSGYAEDIFTKDGIPDGKAEFIQKPVTPAVLLQKVREVLDT